MSDARDVIAAVIGMLMASDEDWTDEDCADRILSALAAAGKVIEQDWQPIETAPREWGEWRDHLQMLLPDGSVSTGWWGADAYARRPRPMWDTERGRLMGRVWQRENQPTHWRILSRPLPAPPAAQGATP